MFWLIKRHPALIAPLCEHLKAHRELLMHVFFGDVTRHYQQLCDLGEIEGADALVADLDSGLEHGDEYLNNVIHVSFLENLSWEKGSVEWDLLTPRLKAGFDMMHGHARQS